MTIETDEQLCEVLNGLMSDVKDSKAELAIKARKWLDIFAIGEGLDHNPDASFSPPTKEFLERQEQKAKDRKDRLFRLISIPDHSTHTEPNEQYSECQTAEDE